MTIVIIVIVVAVLAGGAYFALARKAPAALAPADAKKPDALPAATPKPPDRKPAKQDLVQTVRESPADRKPASLPVPSQKHDAATPIASAPPPSRPKRDVTALRKGLAASRGGFIAKLRALVTGKKEIDPAILEQMEEVMLTSDVGVQTTQAILGRLRERLEKNELGDENAVWDALRAEATEILSVGEHGALKSAGKPTVVLMVGVNGVGKTTTIGKLATRARDDGQESDPRRGRHVPRGCRAAARSLGQARERGRGTRKRGRGSRRRRVRRDDEGERSRRRSPLRRHRGASPHEDAADGRDQKSRRRRSARRSKARRTRRLLVLDATTGQNALQQATQFKEAIDLTGIILTKLDGTAKGGIVLGMCDASESTRSLHRPRGTRGRSPRVRRRGFRRSAFRTRRRSSRGRMKPTNPCDFDCSAEIVRVIVPGRFRRTPDSPIFLSS